jgi:hypothetical protein
MLAVPVPDTFEAAVWLGIGLLFARAFGKRLDQDIQASPWFKQLRPWEKWILKHSLDFLHHWWIGALIMLYIPIPIAYWFGAGIFLDDLPDIPKRVKGYFKFP